MAKIHVTTDDGGTDTITTVGDYPTEDALRSDGYDPDTVSYEVEDPQADLESAIGDASNLQELKDALTGSGAGPPAQARGNGGI